MFLRHKYSEPLTQHPVTFRPASFQPSIAHLVISYRPFPGRESYLEKWRSINCLPHGQGDGKEPRAHPRGLVLSVLQLCHGLPPALTKSRSGCPRMPSAFGLVSSIIPSLLHPPQETQRSGTGPVVVPDYIHLLQSSLSISESFLFESLNACLHIYLKY